MFAICSFHISSNYSQEGHFVHKGIAKSEPVRKELRENTCYCSTKEIILQEDIYTEKYDYL